MSILLQALMQKQATQSNVKLSDMREGSIVLVRGGFGNDPAVEATITAVCRDVKNGRAGVDYIVNATQEKHWAYLDQVKRVITY
jgi:hypothetical protein